MEAMIWSCFVRLALHNSKLTWLRVLLMLNKLCTELDVICAARAYTFQPSTPYLICQWLFSILEHADIEVRLNCPDHGSPADCLWFSQRKINLSLSFFILDDQDFGLLFFGFRILVRFECSLSIGIGVFAIIPTIGDKVVKCNLALQEVDVYQILLSQDLDPLPYWFVVDLLKVCAFFHIDQAHCFHYWGLS